MKAVAADPPSESDRRATIQYTDLERADAMQRGAAATAADAGGSPSGYAIKISSDARDVRMD